MLGRTKTPRSKTWGNSSSPSVVPALHPLMIVLVEALDKLVKALSQGEPCRFGHPLTSLQTLPHQGTPGASPPTPCPRDVEQGLGLAQPSGYRLGSS